MVDDMTLGTVVLGLDDVVLRAARCVDGEVELEIETTTTRTGCPDCGVLARAAWPPHDAVAGSAGAGSPCQLVLGQADLAMRGRRLPTADVDGAA